MIKFNLKLRKTVKLPYYRIINSSTGELIVGFDHYENLEKYVIKHLLEDAGDVESWIRVTQKHGKTSLAHDILGMCHLEIGYDENKT